MTNTSTWRHDEARGGRPIAAGLAYWSLIFALGFALGTVRVMWGAAALGEGTFILIELPIMLGASWLAARWLTRRFRVASTGAALAMGALAFALLMLAEIALTAAMGASPAVWLASLTRPPHLYGFLGQLAFGAMPLVAVRVAGR
ncbi:MAG: hypothetical protein QNI87_06685 [Erythrobacter sp.]|uniref:hypothetical protein n=1 Tax=Erythrobacter sp. TaxID=1042 RepID=UPI0026318F66|nr:hypothetical protein [Erythrobacter sp.]MDJ0978203.1 hypothetical protein [Erythrobacter sp.]